MKSIDLYAEKIQVFAPDKDKDADKVKLTFLKKKSGGGPALWVWPTKEDIEIVDINRVFFGPVVPSLVKGGSVVTFRFKQEQDAAQKFDLLVENGLPQL